MTARRINMGLLALAVLATCPLFIKLAEGKTETAAADLATQLAEIDRFCDGLIPLTKETKRARLFGLYHRDEQDKGEWREFKDQAVLQTAVTDEHVFQFAAVWTRKDGAVALKLTLGSASGDWAHFVEYCFRPDGTLAWSSSTFNTFDASDPDTEKEVSGASRERTRHFDPQGGQLKVARRVLDLKTRKPAPQRSLRDDEEPLFKTTAALPFARLLRTTAAPHAR